MKCSKVQHLVKNRTKQPLQTFLASKGLCFIPGELLSVTDHGILYQDIMKGHVDCMNHQEQLADLLPQIREKHVSDQGNAAQTSGINGGKNTSAGIADEVMATPIGGNNNSRCDENGGGNCCNGIQVYGRTTQTGQFSS